MSDEVPAIARRKADHVEVAASGAADFERTTLLEHVHLVHQALPELGADELELGTELFGRWLAAPVMVTGMTGGTPAAAQINRDLAISAAKAGIAMGVGSQRAMAEHGELTSTYQVKDVAPELFLIGNLGVVQAATLGVSRVTELVKAIEADALAIHLNPGQELIQVDGDRDFRGAIDTIARLVDVLPVPVIVKETGCGLSAQAAARLKFVGVTTVDVAGAGGTSWVAVEARRAAEGSPARALGTELWDWGVPTAVATVACASHGLTTIASGGMRSGYDVARALALGAAMGGLAAPALRAQRAGGTEAIDALLAQVIASIRAVMMLTGCRRPSDLRAVPRHLGAPLRGWLDDLGLPTIGILRP